MQYTTMTKSRFRYLKIASRPGPASRKILSLRSLLTMAFALLLGITAGFNVRDIVLRTHGTWRSQSMTTSHILRSATMTQQPAPTFGSLPRKFLHNIPPKQRSSFLNKPWKYLEITDSGNDRFFMTFLVKATSYLVERRFLIRQTWGSIKEINGAKFGLVFIIGEVTSSEQQELIANENKIYGDILQSNVKDNYINLPLKVLAAMQWVTYEVGNKSDYFVTTDDDCYVNVRATFDYFSKNKSEHLKKIHCGFVYDKSATPIRNKASKYYISYDVYPDETYPDFCHGGMSAMSFDILSDIYRTAETTNFDGFYLEDVLITGILRQKTYNTSDQITAIDYNNVLFHNGRPEVLVWHLGLVRKLQISFAVRWRRAKVSMMINIPTLNQDPKEKDAEFFSAVLLPPATMPGHNLNETMALFVHLWRPFRPKVGPSAIDPNLPNHAQLRQRRMSKEANFQRVIFDANERGGKNVAEIKQKIKINVQHS